jgi:hypothetical protein
MEQILKEKNEETMLCDLMYLPLASANRRVPHTGWMDQLKESFS